MIRRIICIDEEKCDGCGLCAKACHEGAIDIVDGKAKLVRENFCDGFGDCLPNCPTGAISFEERETVAYDQLAVERAKQQKEALHNWPIQIKLAPLQSPVFKNSNLLIAADCTGFAYANFHKEFSKDKVVLIGCTKLDKEDYSVKLSEIFRNNEIKEITILKMEVPCCSGMELAVKRAIEASGKQIPFITKTISIDGRIL